MDTTSLPTGAPGARPPSLRSSPAFLFTDIEAGTCRWERHPEVMQRALACAAQTPMSSLP